MAKKKRKVTESKEKFFRKWCEFIRIVEPFGSDCFHAPFSSFMGVHIASVAGATARRPDEGINGPTTFMSQLINVHEPFRLYLPL